MMERLHTVDLSDCSLNVHTNEEHAVYLALKKVAPDSNGNVHTGYGVLARLTGMTRSSVVRAIHRLAKKHSIDIVRQGRRFTRGPEALKSNVYRILSAVEIRLAREADDLIAKEGNGKTWVTAHKIFVTPGGLQRKSIRVLPKATTQIVATFRNRSNVPEVATWAELELSACLRSAEASIQAGELKPAARYLKRAISLSVDDNQTRTLVMRLIDVAEAQSAEADRRSNLQYVLRKCRVAQSGIVGEGAR